MSKSKFLTLLEETNRPLLSDGAMGSMLHSQGVSFGHFDAVNLSQPDLVANMHRAYIDAGSQIILTNSFGANRYKLAEHGLENKLADINETAVSIAQRAVQDSGKVVLIAGDVGPLGVRLAPFGRVQPVQARQAFAEQIEFLASAGADLILIETITDLFEIYEAIAAARAVCDLPVVASMTFTRDDRTLLGDTPETVTRKLIEAGPDMIGANCSGGPTQLLRILKKMRQVAPGARFSVKPNAGFPEQLAGRIMYPASPAYFGDYALAFYQAGAHLIGGCCGTTPDHIRAMQSALVNAPSLTVSDKLTVARAEPDEQLATVDQPSVLAQRLAAGDFVAAVEMHPPRGTSTHKLLAGASLLAEAGVDVINVADSPMARMRMSPWAVCNLLQRKIKVESTLHFPTRGRNLLRLQGDLLAAHALGVRNVFVVMGDPTAIGDYPDAMDDYDLVPSGVIKLIKQGFNTGVDHAGVKIGQPTTFFVGGALNLTPVNPDRESRVLQRKIQSGVDFLLTQPVFQPEQAEAFLDRYQEAEGPLKQPILLGVLPLNNPRHASFLHNEVPGINIPEEVIRRLETAGEDAPQEGVKIALELIRALQRRVNGIYIIPAFNRYDLVAEIIETIK
jgi:homocysteine S-methyltransferase